MDDFRSRLETRLRAKLEPKLQRELREAERRINDRYSEEIEAFVREAVVKAELDAWEERNSAVDRDRLAEIADEAEAIRGRYEAMIQEEVEARVSARRARGR